jgi:hypothetical protein
MALELLDEFRDDGHDARKVPVEKGSVNAGSGEPDCRGNAVAGKNERSDFNRE